MTRYLVVCVLSVALSACSDSRTPNPTAQTQIPGIESTPISQPEVVDSEGAPEQQAEDHPPAQNPNRVVVRDTILNRDIELNFINLPAVTDEDVRQLQQALNARGNNERTSIITMPAFRAAEAKTSIGLYHAVMGGYPDLTLAGVSEARRTQIQQAWAANPDLPLTYTTTAEDVAFAQELSRLTGRRFTVMSNSQNEYSIRGRTLDASGRPTGAITSTIYHFGDDEAQVRNRAFILTNPLTQNRTHGVHEIPAGQDSLYRNSFGLIHPIGNVWSRSLEGVVRGGSFSSLGWNADSSRSLEGYESFRIGYIGFRLAEDILP